MTESATAAGTESEAATVTETTAGAAKTDAHTAQASWNVTTTPFSGFDPTKINIYKIEYGYLGVANINRGAPGEAERLLAEGRTLDDLDGRLRVQRVDPGF